jgi:PhnB protein
VNLTPHIVVTDANAAAAWYAHGFGAEERGRVPLPGGGVMSVELAAGAAKAL